MKVKLYSDLIGKNKINTLWVKTPLAKYPLQHSANFGYPWLAVLWKVVLSITSIPFTHFDLGKTCFWFHGSSELWAMTVFVFRSCIPLTTPGLWVQVQHNPNRWHKAEVLRKYVSIEGGTKWIAQAVFVINFFQNNIVKHLNILKSKCHDWLSNGLIPKANKIIRPFKILLDSIYRSFDKECAGKYISRICVLFLCSNRFSSLAETGKFTCLESEPCTCYCQILFSLYLLHCSFKLLLNRKYLIYKSFLHNSFQLIISVVHFSNILQ